jgi:hypothetical protein
VASFAVQRHSLNEMDDCVRKLGREVLTKQTSNTERRSLRVISSWLIVIGAESSRVKGSASRGWGIENRGFRVQNSVSRSRGSRIEAQGIRFEPKLVLTSNGTSAGIAA